MLCMCVCLVMSALCYPMDCSPTGSSVHGILQGRILEQVAISSSRGSSQPRDRTHAPCVSCIDRQILYHSATKEAWKSHVYHIMILVYLYLKHRISYRGFLWLQSWYVGSFYLLQHLINQNTLLWTGSSNKDLLQKRCEQMSQQI